MVPRFQSIISEEIKWQLKRRRKAKENLHYVAGMYSVVAVMLLDRFIISYMKRK